jgi:hypothetical protein
LTKQQILHAALQQIEEKYYDSRLLESDVPKENIRKLAIVIQGNKAFIKPEEKK